ncbi:hypothetical protein [Microvirga sp. VF16]|uniref:hypothetical protein n=1 Tax=Microvirga sp. VF16 TaxID=2807101 RepID=UPI00193D0DB5|nr:hypothetical protein [Microvirga sp. VF16]QRM34667.1 hypothetical protein JO965_41000 [Microvirga sp. VF16]
MRLIYNGLERQIIRAFRRAVAENRLDVADHLFQALEAMDPEFESIALPDSGRSILERTKAVPQGRH